jgi:hypothetical protein
MYLHDLGEKNEEPVQLISTNKRNKFVAVRVAVVSLFLLLVVVTKSFRIEKKGK